ncbi:MAG: right-handed parallel beta-helix repeat-containing protein, partial [Pseudomonadota bacterium]
GPVSAPQTGVAGFARVQLQGNQISIVGGEEVALKGVDGEVGFRLPTEYLKIDPNLFELRAYAGGYHFYSDDAEDNVTGVKGRLEVRVNDVIASIPGSRLTVDYEVSHDDVRETRHDVGLRMRIPLNGGQSVRSLASLSHQKRRMLDGVERDTDIVTGRSKREDVEDALTGTDLDRVAYADATNDVTTTSTTAGDNSLIIVNGTVTGNQEIQANQTLQGGGSTIEIRGRRTGIVLPFTASGTAGRLETPGDYTQNLLVNGSNIHVSGITIDGSYNSVTDANEGSWGLVIGTNSQNTFLTNLGVMNTYEAGVSSEDSVNVDVTVRDVRISNIETFGMRFGDESTIVVEGLTIDSSEGGLLFGDNNNEIHISNATITNNRGAGMRFGSGNGEIVISNSGITNSNGRDAMQFSSLNTDIEISNVTIRGDVGDAVELGHSNVAVISGLDVVGSDKGIAMISRNATAIITNSSFTDIGGKVFDSGNEATWSVQNSVINGAADDVFEFGTDDKLFVAGNTFLGDIAGNIFSFEQNGAEVQDGSTGNDISGVTFTAGGQVCAVVSGRTFSGSTINFLDGTTVSPPTC